MYFLADALQNIALSLMKFSANTGQQVVGYIDPNNMQHVFTFFGPLLAFFAAVVSVVISVIFFIRHQIICWFKKASGMKLFVVLLIFVLIVTSAIIVAYKLVLRPAIH
jgi:hypothetical protein